ncbi:MAG: hypothetical protein VKN33_04765 [Candidatus Sericytochromatia bacterium]|nr:hypothetical protein [Candidatus Sericytochromatia bacterium]
MKLHPEIICLGVAFPRVDRCVLACAFLPFFLKCAPASAFPADPLRSQIHAHAPHLAPQVWGRATLSGQWDPSGRISLNAPAQRIFTGHLLYDSFLRRSLAPTLSLTTTPITGLDRIAGSHRVRVTGLARVGHVMVELPLMLRLQRLNQGVAVRTFISVPLEPFGVINPLGGTPGQVRAAIHAYFPLPATP